MNIKSTSAINATCAMRKTKKTMNEYRYKLEKKGKKFICRKCDKLSFIRYIDLVTGQYLPIQYGRCNHESKCSCHLNPYTDGYVRMIQADEQRVNTEKQKWQLTTLQTMPPKVKELEFIPWKILQHTMQSDRYESNLFVQNLLHKVDYPFSTLDIDKIISLYFLGTISKGYRAGAIAFPFIDIQQNIRAIQIKQFDRSNNTLSTDFLHSIIEKELVKQNKPLPMWLAKYKSNEKVISCLFGEHLLAKYPTNPIALVEAPKSAIYATLYFGFPEKPNNLIWLAVYNKSSFSFEKLNILKGRDIYTFPDLSKNGQTFKEWEQKASNYESRMLGTRFVFSDLLEKYAPELDRYNGLDIADYLIKLDWRKFRKEVVTKSVQSVICEKREKWDTMKQQLFSSNGSSQDRFCEIEKHPPIAWDIQELKDFFNNRILPQSIQLNSFSTIHDVKKFVESHLEYVEYHNGLKTFLPYFERLQELKTVLKNFNIPEPDD